MSAGFIIIHQAIRNAERRRKEEEREKKMKADGYVREFVMTNPKRCYVHSYRNSNTQQSGFNLLITSFVLSLTIINLYFAVPLNAWALLPLAIFLILFFIGFSMYFNDEREWSDSREYNKREGCVHLKTEYEPNYVWTWVKKDKE